MITILLTMLPLLVLAPAMAALIWLGPSLGKGLAGWLLLMAFLVSPVVVWIYFDFAVGPRFFPDASWGERKIQDLLLSREGIILGFLLVNLPGATQLFLWAFQSVDRSLIESAFCAGASRLKTWIRVVLPVARPAILAAGLGTFLIVAAQWSFLLLMSESSPVARKLLTNVFQIKTGPEDFAAFLAASQSIEIGSVGEMIYGVFFLCVVGLGLYYYLQKRPEGPWANR
jgi:ABC-type Fe3+ transport system permease subunit